MDTGSSGSGNAASHSLTLNASLQDGGTTLGATHIGISLTATIESNQPTLQGNDGDNLIRGLHFSVLSEDAGYTRMFGGAGDILIGGAGKQTRIILTTHQSVCYRSPHFRNDRYTAANTEWRIAA